MTVDREQTRRDAERKKMSSDAEWMIDACQLAPNGAGAVISRYVLALLAELEQAERERDEANSDAHELSLSLNAAVEAAQKYSARLAKVPELVEALRYIRGDDVAGMDGHQRPEKVAAAALAAFEATGVPS